MSHPSVLFRFHAPRASSWIPWLTLLAALGVMAGCHAGFQTGYAAYERENYEKAAQKLEPLAERGHARSQFLLGLMHDRGHGVERDLERAAAWYEQAATQGFAPAQTNLGVLLQTGAVDEPAPEHAARWYEQASAQGHAAARHNLAMLLLTGRGVKVDRDRARTLLKHAARDGDANAQYLYGSLLAEGVEPMENAKAADADLDETAKRRAARWYEKAAEQGHAPARFALALLYDTGRGVRPDYEKAVELYTLAAEAGHAPAQHNLALMYAAGRGVEPDLDLARDWYRRYQSASTDNATDETTITAVPTP